MRQFPARPYYDGPAPRMRPAPLLACLLLLAGCAGSRPAPPGDTPRVRQLHDQFTGTGTSAHADDPTSLQMKALFAMRDEGLLHKGMAERQVLALLGDPYYRSTDNSPEWRYSLPGGGLSLELDLHGHVTQISRWFESDHPMPRERW